MPESANGLLRVEGLTVDFDVGKPTAHRALDSVSLSIAQGEIVGLLGESGS
jgi:ABC-type glutathione transport system ATPase component